MTDANLAEFYGRIARIEKGRAMGFGHEANGTLGRSHYHRARKRQRGVVLPLLLVCAAAFGMKGTIHNHVGDTVYQQRVERMISADGFSRLGGQLMQADPVTLFVSHQIARIKNNA